MLKEIISKIVYSLSIEFVIIWVIFNISWWMFWFYKRVCMLVYVKFDIFEYNFFFIFFVMLFKN